MFNGQQQLDVDNFRSLVFVCLSVCLLRKRFFRFFNSLRVKEGQESGMLRVVSTERNRSV